MLTSNKGGFLERLTRSQLLDADQLAACVALAGDDDLALIEHLVQAGHLTRFQARQIRAGATNFRVGKYVITDCIGRGGNGIVYKARHQLMQRYVALKTLDARNLHFADEALSRFQREIEIISQLDHPNVVRAFDVVQTRNQIYLVLEFVSGKDLGAVVKDRGPLPIPEAVSYAIQTARALHYAHSQGVVHRDLKPANLLLTLEGVVKLSDLGLAKLFDGEQDAATTIKGLCLGTPEYMAPEQAEDAHAADPRSDIYGLGSTLFHLMTGQLPVAGNSYLHRLQHLLTAPPRPLLSVFPEAPPGLAVIVDRMRERDPAARPATAQQVVELLLPFSQDETHANPAPMPAQQKAELVLQMLSGQLTPAAICAEHHLALVDLERWRQQFVEAGIRALVD
jgi:serine/threonine protein kinase